MKKALRLTVLVGIVGLTSWLSTGKVAQALPNCEILAGKGCSPNGSRVDCVTVWGDPGVCVCSGNRYSCMF
jgi:hypothetical protein